MVTINRVAFPDATGPVATFDLAIGFVIVFRYTDDPAVATWNPRPVTGSDGEEWTSFGLGILAGAFAAEAEVKVDEPADWIY